MPTTFNLALSEALKNKAVHAAIELIKTNTQPALLDHRDANGYTPLQHAAINGMLEVVLWLSYAGATIDARYAPASNTPSDKQKTALTLAIDNGQGLIAQVLLCLGAKQTLKLHQKAMPLQFDPYVWASLYQWAIRHYHQPFKRRLFDLLAHGQLKNKLPLNNTPAAETTPLTEKLLADIEPQHRISLHTWAIMLNGLMAFADANHLISAQSLLEADIAKIAPAQLLRPQLNPLEHGLHFYLKRHTPGYGYTNNTRAYLNALNQLACEYDLMTIQFVLTEPHLGIDRIFNHALNTKNKNLCTILMFITDHHLNALTPFAKKIHHFLAPLAPIADFKATDRINILSLLLNTQQGSAQLIRAFCDEQSLLRLARTTRTNNQFLKTVMADGYLLRSRFMGELQSALNQQGVFSHRRQWHSFIMLAMIVLPLTVIFSLLPTLLQKVHAIQVLDQFMHTITYALNTTKHCDDFAMNGAFPPNCLAITSDAWANCHDSCQQLNTLASDFLGILVFGEITPTIPLIIDLGFAYYYNLPKLFKEFCAGERRFDRVSLNQLQPALNTPVEQIVRVLNEEHYRIPLNEALCRQQTDSRLNAPTSYTSIAAIRDDFHRTKNYYGAFFKAIRLAPVVSTDVTISIEEQPAFSTPGLSASAALS